MDIPLRRRHAELPATLDRSAPLAAPGAVPEIGADAPRSSRRHFELLPDQGAAGSCRSDQWEYQISAPPWPRLQEPTLPAVEGPAHGRHQDRIRDLQESSLKC